MIIYLFIAELLTEVFPMLYNDNASAIVHRVYTYMSVTNRSISSIEVLKSAAAVLVNLTRYRITGPKIYLVRFDKTGNFSRYLDLDVKRLGVFL